MDPLTINLRKPPTFPAIGELVPFTSAREGMTVGFRGESHEASADLQPGRSDPAISSAANRRGGAAREHRVPLNERRNPRAVPGGRDECLPAEQGNLARSGDTPFAATEAEGLTHG